jgi:hypothetical protein
MLSAAKVVPDDRSLAGQIFVFFNEVVQIEMIKKSALELWGGKLLNGAFA